MGKWTPFLVFIVIIGIFLGTLGVKIKHRQMNLIIISVDTLRTDHMGVYGYIKNTTPNIDDWAKKAYVFTNVYTTDPFTYPSVATFMTGQYPLTTRIITNGTSLPLSDNTQTLANIMKKNGYQTAGFISNRFISSKLSNLNQGFDQFSEYDAFDDWKKKREDYNNFINSSLEWIDRNQSGKLFLWVHLMDPHYPYYPSSEFLCKYDRDYCSELQGKSIDEIRDKAKKIFRSEKQEVGCTKEKVSYDQINPFLALYDGEIASADLLVKSILNKLQQTGLDKKSLVVIYGDHGEGFDHNYYFHHGAVLYNSSVRIPLIIKYPNFTSQKIRIDQLIDNSDIFPTILELLGISNYSHNIDGRSFSDIFSTQPFSKIIPIKKREYIYSVNNELSKFSIYDGQYKFIYSLNQACLYKNQKEELYDLKNDPDELINIAEEKITIAEKMKTQLLNYLSKYNLPQYKLQNIKPEKNNNEILDQLKSLGY